ncbi:uncharacterized protein M421DRAFT_73891, partial [Didymella exigua CBS 183.55]
LLRTEVLGLKAWLAQIRVLGTNPDCTCGHPRQTLSHARLKLMERAGTTDLPRILINQEKVVAAGRWLLDTGLLEQF